MARPCGCGSGGLTVRCSSGVSCAGLGTTTDPLVIQWDIPLAEVACGAVMNCVGDHLNQGLVMTGGRLGVRLASGGGLDFDIAGGLRVIGGGGGGGGGNPATVAALASLTKDVIGGAIGGGFMIKPPNMMQSYAYGMQAGLHFMQVPVRFLNDGSPVVYMQETMENTTPPFSFAHVQDQDSHRWKVFANKPGHHILPSGENFVDYGDPKLGWFGYLEPGEPSLVFLADVLRQFGGKVVLLLDLRFPATDLAGNFVHATPPWRTAIFRERVRLMIQEMGLTSSVIVTSTMPFIPDNDPADPTKKFDLLKYYSDAGIAVGPFFETGTAAGAYPPGPNWPSNWTWAFLSSSIPRGTLLSYVNQQVGSPAKPLNVILFYVTRQYLRESLVNNSIQTPGATGIGAKGVLSADPEYYFARSRYWYRKADNTWAFSTVDHGLLPHEPDNLVSMNCLRRGHHLATYPSMWFGPDNYKPPDPITSTGWSLQGWFGPSDPSLANNRFYDLGFGFDQRTNTVADYGWMAMAFCVPTDHMFQNFGGGASQPPGVDYSLDNGYILLYDTNGYLFLWCVTLGVTEKMATEVIPYDSPPVVIGSSGWSDPRRGKPYYFRVGINANGLKVSRITAPGAGSPGTVVYSVTDALAKRHRGGYVSFGRRGSFWNGFIDNPKMGSTGAPPNGP
jgi:hypothetical protein